VYVCLCVVVCECMRAYVCMDVFVCGCVCVYVLMCLCVWNMNSVNDRVMACECDL
jgi:hypothetical protein